MEAIMKNFSRSTTAHMLIIGFFMLLFLIPLSMVQELVSERQGRQVEAVDKVRKNWAYTQYVGGPVLVFPYHSVNNEGDEIVRYLNVSPDTMIVDGVMHPDILYRSIYEIPVYRSQLAISGNFSLPDFRSQGISENSILWEQVFVSFLISDLKGISEETKIVWNDTPIAFQSGPGRARTFLSGLHTLVPIELIENSENIKDFKPKREKYAYKIDVNLKGSESLFIAPIGKQTSVSLSSTWKSPKFTGNFLPETRSVTDDGFQATWKILSYNRDIPEMWHGSMRNKIYSNSIGVQLFMEVNAYSKTDKTVKYGFLLILFTFTVFFFAEVLGKKKIHPIHYTLVGISLVIFYVLLLSFAEHIDFNLSYLIATLATSGLISYYSFSIYRSKIIGFITSIELLLLYGFVFVILHLYEYSLLTGSIGVFIILAVIMYLSKSIDWYNVMHASTREKESKETSL